MKPRILVALLGLMLTPLLMGQWLPILGAGSTIGPSYIFSENFEGPGYQNSWTESTAGGSSITANDTSFPTQGSYDCKIIYVSGTVSTTASFSGTASMNTYGFFTIRVGSTSFNADILRILDGSSSTLVGVSVRSTGALRITVGSAITTTSGTMSVNTNYYIWYHANFSTGAVDVEFETNATQVGSGSNFASTTGGTTSVTPAKIQLINPSAADTRYYDYIRVNNSNIGSNPQ